MAELRISNMTEDEVGMLVSVLIGADPLSMLDDLDIGSWEFMLASPSVDTSSSASRQHHIDTGRYLTTAEAQEYER